MPFHYVGTLSFPGILLHDRYYMIVIIIMGWFNESTMKCPDPFTLSLLKLVIA